MTNKSHSKSITHQKFVLRDCALIAMATGKRARSLIGLRDQLETIEEESIYYHFWGGLLRPQFEDYEYHNDFASWAAHTLNDRTMAERLGIIDPTKYENLDQLRQELVELIDERIDELEEIPWAPRDKQFEFIVSDIVVFTTKQALSEPEALLGIIPKMSLGSIFYHFIDARRRSPQRTDDFTPWLKSFGKRYQDLIDGIMGIDPCLTSLSALRDELTEEFSNHLEVN